ncbi:MAG: type IV pilus secretin PilQ [Acidobacteriota bacterium]|nr:type IV pilus secretin PilQ [Acidobacteriota bacterium]
MNSFHKLGDYGRRPVIALMIISIFALSIAAQTVVRPQTQGRMYGGAGFVGESINLNVVNADIRDILNYITEQYGVNFVIDKSVSAVPVTVNVNDVPWDIALDSVLRAQGLGVQVNGTILRIADQKTLASEQDVLVKIRDSQLDTSPLLTEFIRLNYARASGTLSAAAGNANNLTTGTSSFDPRQRTFSDVQVSGSASSVGALANRITSGGDQGILGIIQKRLSRRGAVEVDGRSNTLIVTDVRENIDAIRQLVSLLDQPEPQVEIETRIVVANRSFARDIGIQLFGLLTGANGAGLQGGTLNNAPLGGSKAPPAGLPLQGPDGSLLSSIPNTIIGLTTGVFGTAQISAMISAGEQKGNAKVIASPRITTLNNRPAEIKSGTKIPIATIQPGGSGGDPIVTTEYVDVPLRLAITPQITDVGTVILNVVAENSSISSRVAGGTPSIDSQSMTTQVTVPDGGTTVVGGVVLDNEGESQDRTPGLSSIPILGNLFKRKSVSRSTQEILFFITPRIYRQDFIGGERRATTIIQPVPLGNPDSNSGQPSQSPVLPAPPPLRP